MLEIVSRKKAVQVREGFKNFLPLVFGNAVYRTVDTAFHVFLIHFGFKRISAYRTEGHC